MKKRIISLALILSMMAVLVPFNQMGMQVSAASHSVDEAMLWCESLLGQTVGSGQCVAFVQSYYSYLGASPVSGNACDYATNSLPSGWSRVKGGTPQKGDILIYIGAKYGHVAIYAGGTVSYHQNMAGKYVEKKTSWAYNKSWYSTAEGGTKSYWGYIRPDFSNPIVTHTRDTNYGTDFTATAKAKQNAQTESHNTLSNRWVDAGDQCTIHEVYTDGCCRVTYPTSSGTATYYFKISNFEWNSTPISEPDPTPVDIGTNFYAYIINTAVWKHATHDGRNVSSRSESCDLNQVWKFERQSDLSYKIINMYDYQCLDVCDALSTSGANVQVCPSNDSNAQRWYIYGESGAYKLRAKCTNCYLDLYDDSSDEGANLQMWEKNDSAAQKFQIWKLDNFREAVSVGEDFYAVVLMKSAWKPISNESPNVELQTERGIANQLWHFKRQSDGSYFIISAKDGKYLDVEGASRTNGANIQVYDGHGENNQRWYIHQENGGFSIGTKMNRLACNYVLDVEGAITDDGHNIQLHEYNGTNAQIFAIYQGSEIYLSATTVSVAAGTSESETKFTWNNVYGENGYDVKLWNGKYWEGDPYHIEWGAEGLSYSKKLPAGYYEGYVDASNALECKMSNVICFKVKPVIHVAKEGNSYKFTWDKALSVKQYQLEVVNTDTNQTVVNTYLEKDAVSYTAALESGNYKARITPIFTTTYSPSDGSSSFNSISSDYVAFKVDSVILSSITIKTTPTKIGYNVGDMLDTTGLVLIATYSDGTKKEITKGYTCSPMLLNAAGLQTITVTYGGKTVTFKVKVNEVTTSTIGDVNSDGTVNSKDLTRLMKYIAGEDVAINTSAADVNGDGTINGKDLTRLMKTIAESA